LCGSIDREKGLDIVNTLIIRKKIYRLKYIGVMLVHQQNRGEESIRGAGPQYPLEEGEKCGATMLPLPHEKGRGRAVVFLVGVSLSISKDKSKPGRGVKIKETGPQRR